MNYDLNNLAKKFNKLKRRSKAVFAKKRNQRRTYYLFTGLVIFSLVLGLVFSLSHSSEQSYILKTRQQKLQSLTQKLQQVQQQKAVSESQLQQKAATEANLQSQIDQLNQQLQAKAEAKEQARQASLASRVINTVTQTKTAYAAPSVNACGTGDANLDFIISHESGCNPYAVNASSGACGLFQRLPCTVPLGDVATQMADGLAYINSRYGSTAGAVAFWQTNHWY